MTALKKIALVTCGSNFERHGNTIRAMRRKLMDMGGYALYVITNYGVYSDGMDFTQGEPAIYQLLEILDIDGCILEANLGSLELAKRITGILKKRGIPVLAINLKLADVPCLRLEIKTAGMELLEHLILTHSCSRINLALSEGNRVISETMLDVYRSILPKYGIPFDESRVLSTAVSFQSGDVIYNTFDQRGVMQDAQAVVCVHDVSAIGLCMALEARGLRAPDDLRICSVNCSGNSIAWSPSITGIDHMDGKAAELACELMDQMLAGKEVSQDNTYPGEVRYLSSCGCTASDSAHHDNPGVFHRLVVNKVEAANQIGRMMQFNNALEDVESLAQLASNIHRMMLGIGCRSYFCCLNEDDLSYIESDSPETKDAGEVPYHDRMVVLSGDSGRTGEITGVSFGLEALVPAAPQAGDFFLLLPIHYINHSYGYMVFLNEMLPVDNYHYRICQDSIGASIENLHRQMILKSNIAELDRLHMQDQLTGLKNRFAFKRYRNDYVHSPAGYSVAVLDIDGLKTINDHFGHLAGNNAISIAAGVIRESVGKTDLVIRYGGDEFLVLSHETSADLWERRRLRIDEQLEKAPSGRSCRIASASAWAMPFLRRKLPCPWRKAWSLRTGRCTKTRRTEKHGGKHNPYLFSRAWGA